MRALPDEQTSLSAGNIAPVRRHFETRARKHLLEVADRLAVLTDDFRIAHRNVVPPLAKGRRVARELHAHTAGELDPVDETVA